MFYLCHVTTDAFCRLYEYSVGKGIQWPIRLPRIGSPFRAVALEVLNFAKGNRITNHRCAAATSIIVGSLFFPSHLPGQSNSPVTPATVVTNATQTPVEGVGHDYLHDLNEIVNPQNGQVSIRIAGPTPKERGITLPHIAFMYDTSGAYALSAQLLFGSCQTEGSSVPVCTESVLAPIWATPISLVGVGGGVGSNADGLFAASTTVTLDLGIDNGSKSCTYQGPYIYEDPQGGLHNLEVANVTGGTDCTVFNITNQNIYGDGHYKAIDLNGTVTLSDTHGNILGGTGLGGQDEDSNGNYPNSTGRPFSHCQFNVLASLCGSGRH